MSNINDPENRKFRCTQCGQWIEKYELAEKYLGKWCHQLCVLRGINPTKFKKGRQWPPSF